MKQLEKCTKVVEQFKCNATANYKAANFNYEAYNWGGTSISQVFQAPGGAKVRQKPGIHADRLAPWAYKLPNMKPIK